MEPLVRHARLDDISCLKNLDPWPKDKVWHRIIGNGEVIVLELGSRVIGVARFSVLWTTVPFLGLINISSEHRGKGYSRLLLSYLMQYLRDEGYVALLSSSQTDEPKPQAWHRHMGFKTSGIIENIADDGIGEIVFRIEL